ncbi:MAG: OmpA family protein [Calditrichaeota bacterium]|nr:OmpA family protein [Calditrichota bacterium]
MRYINFPTTAVIILLNFLLLFGQNQGKSAIFDRYDRLIEQISENNAKLLSPRNYEKALKYYLEASRDYDNRDGDMESIKKKLSKSESYALEALKNIEIANSLLSDALNDRDDALDANAPQYAVDFWEKGEKYLIKAAKKVEDGDRDDAMELGEKASKYYKVARVQALTNSILEEPRLAIEEAKKEGAHKWSYHTFQAAVNALKETEDLINQNPNDLDAARERAAEASYHARHSIFLTKTIKLLKKKDENLELMLLNFEDMLTSLSAPFNYKPQFDQGFNETVQAIVAYISNLKEEQKRLLEENTRLEEELSSLREKEINVSETLRKQQEIQEKIAKIKDLFDPAEVEVSVQDDNLMIRLTGLKFRPGRAIIQPEYFSLLTKVQRAIREFPDSYIVVEGHTDATGNAYKNKILSEQRANAVKEYLIANLELSDDQIQAIGMGDQKPIASNKTVEGRERNRRIDILIALPK